MKTNRLYCPNCDAVTKATSERASHGLHALGTLLTGGLWGAVWAGSAASAAQVWNCARCGAAISAETIQRERWGRSFRRIGRALKLAVVYPAAALATLMVIGALTR